MKCVLAASRRLMYGWALVRVSACSSTVSNNQTKNIPNYYSVLSTILRNGNYIFLHFDHIRMYITQKQGNWTLTFHLQHGSWKMPYFCVWYLHTMLQLVLFDKRLMLIWIDTADYDGYIKNFVTSDFFNYKSLQMFTNVYKCFQTTTDLGVLIKLPILSIVEEKYILK